VAATWATIGHPYPRAYALWRIAEARLSRRQARGGEAVLREAHAIALRLGAAPLQRELELLAERGRIELGDEEAAPAQAPGRGGEHGLTPRELQVLALVAAGRTNREIAQALFVTEKTAGAHVSNILAKLRVRSRVQAATVAHRLGLLGG
jgi:DNA-binding NarL/FixJ family response regulator